MSVMHQDNDTGCALFSCATNPDMIHGVEWQYTSMHTGSLIALK